MSLVDDQRAIFIAALVATDSTAARMGHPELMFAYLGVVELRTELTLLERLYGWAAANGIPMTLAAVTLGF